MPTFTKKSVNLCRCGCWKPEGARICFRCWRVRQHRLEVMHERNRMRHYSATRRLTLAKNTPPRNPGLPLEGSPMLPETSVYSKDSNSVCCGAKSLPQFLRGGLKGRANG